MPLACIATLLECELASMAPFLVSGTGLGENSLKGLEPLAHLEIRTSCVEDLRAAKDTAQKGEENSRLGVTVPVSVRPSAAAASPAWWR
jgi:hypothetical protein